jgi:8-oxo-dGTP pyrophosphatase MutT (NUDIX family)
MSMAVRNNRGSRLAVIPSLARTQQPEAKSVRVSQLRKLRQCEQVAAVCYRVRDGAIEFLLVQTRGSRRWTFPKGGAEPGLTHAQAAALEAFEEAGVHGRIEEISFARYLRRRQVDARSSTKLVAKAIAVSAHLCEVLRLCTPKESNRNRTWFSVDESKRRLRDARENRDGTRLARVVDKAIARIRLNGGSGLGSERIRTVAQQDFRPSHPREKDALQKIRFEASERATGQSPEASLPHFRRQTGEMRRFALPAGDVYHRGTLLGEVLQFGLPRQSSRSPRLLTGTKNVKASGNGAKNT